MKTKVEMETAITRIQPPSIPYPLSTGSFPYGEGVPLRGTYNTSWSIDRVVAHLYVSYPSKKGNHSPIGSGHRDEPRPAQPSKLIDPPSEDTLLRRVISLDGWAGPVTPNTLYTQRVYPPKEGVLGEPARKSRNSSNRLSYRRLIGQPVDQSTYFHYTTCLKSYDFCDLQVCLHLVDALV